MRKTRFLGIAAALVAAVSLSFVSCNNDTTTEEAAAGVTGIVSGYVIDTQTQKGVEGVKVTVAGHSATTNSAGVYVISGVEPNNSTANGAAAEKYTAVFTKDDYLQATKADIYVNPNEYTTADPFGEGALTAKYLEDLATNTASGTTTNSSNNTSTSDNVTVKYVQECLTTYMEKISYSYGVDIGKTILTPLTSGITGTLYLDDVENDEINTTTTKAPKGAVISFTYNGAELGSTTTNDEGVFEFYGLPTGVLPAAVTYTVDYTNTENNKYYSGKAALSTLDNGKTDTLSVNEKDVITTYFQAGNVFAYLTDVIKLLENSSYNKEIAVTDSITLKYDHQLISASSTDKTIIVSFVNGENTSTVTIAPVTVLSNATPSIKVVSNTNSGATRTDTLALTFASMKLVSMSVVDEIPAASRMAVTAAQYLKLVFNMEVAEVDNCVVGTTKTDVVIAKDDAKIVYIPFNDNVNSTVNSKITGTVVAKASSALMANLATVTNSEQFFANQSNYIASTNLNSDGELSYGADLVLTFAADFGTYTDIKVAPVTGSVKYVASYDATSKTMTISNADKTELASASLTINVMNGSTTVYSTSNKYFGQKASEGAVSGTVNNINTVTFSVVKPTVSTSTTATEFNKSINTPIAITFDRAVTGYKVLLLNGSTTYTKYDDVVANDAEIIIPSATATSADGKTLTVTPAGIYDCNDTVYPTFYTANGDNVAITVSTYSFASDASKEKYFTALSATANSITASLSSKSVKDNVYTATFDFTPEYEYTKSGSKNTYKLYSRATNIRGIVGTWTLYNDNIPVSSDDISIAKTATTSATGTFGGNKSVDFLLVTTVDNLKKSYYYAGFADTTKPNFTSITSATYNETDVKWELSSNPTVKGTTTYTVTASEAIATATVVATFKKATETVTNKQLTIGHNSFTFDVVSSDATDTFTAADYVTITVTDYAGNSYTVPLYCK